jgi:DNA end-binding protein Ku
MRSMWKGAISFGLVMIPVKLYAATEQKDISFRQVHRADGGRIRFRRVCSIDGAEVPYEEVAKGFELPGGEMVVLTDEDLADLPLASSKSIEVMHFTPADQLDPILFNRSYYVEPETAGGRAYVLLRDALERSDRVAICQVALRQREALATLRTRDGVLVLETLLWPDEVRSAEFPFLDDDIEVRSQELRMATSLIDSMTVDFDPEEYHDRYREALQELVEAKVEGRDVIQPEEGEVSGAPASLADALKASLAAARGDQPEAGSPRAKGSRSAAAGKSSTGTKRTASASSTRARSARAQADPKDADAASGAAKSAVPQRSARSSRAANGKQDENAAPAKTTRAKAARAAKDAPAAEDAGQEPTTQRRTRRRAS